MKSLAPRSFVLGVIVGVLIGSSGLAAAALGYKGWTRFSKDFQLGYISGFMDMANLARNLDPGGFVDERYPLWPQAKTMHWHGAVAKIYQDPDKQRYSMYSVLQFAADELEKTFGKPPTAMERVAPQLKDMFAKGKEMDSAPPKPDAPATPPAPKAPQPPKKKIWCKCAEMEKACPELAKEWTTRKPKTDAADQAAPQSPANIPAPAEVTK